MSDVLDEYGMLETMRQPELDAFKARGVPPLALAEPDALCRDTVVFLEGGRFEFKRWADDVSGATGAVIILVRSGLDYAMDLVAWTPGTDRLASWLGYAGMLGEGHAASARIAEGLKVHRSPLTWLQSSRRGVVIVDPRRAAPILRNVGPIEAEDHAHARELRATLAEPPIRIILPAGSVAA
ncbi:hypothetical protein [Hansschlegelia sp. KR7-227]|uniref:hypothetical protein n=1 Tax=Hansschlegelia sp. KR7-227 TaxID=3400914 RepID=UPI003C09856F